MIDANPDFTAVFGTVVPRPAYIPRRQWLEYWEAAAEMWSSEEFSPDLLEREYEKGYDEAMTEMGQ